MKQWSTAWILFPYATTRSWGHAMIFKDKKSAEAYAKEDAFYVVPKRIKIQINDLNS